MNQLIPPHLYASRPPNRSPELGTILEESYMSRTQGLANSGSTYNNISDITNTLANSSSYAYNQPESMAPRPRNITSYVVNRGNENSPQGTNWGRQVVVVNNRRFLTSKSPTKSPPSHSFAVDGVHHLRPSRRASKSPIAAFSAEKEDPVQKQLIEKIKQLEQKVSQLEQEKKNSIINLLKEKEDLRQMLSSERSLSLAVQKQAQDTISELRQQLQEQAELKKKQSYEMTSTRLLEMSHAEEIETLKRENSELRAQLEQRKETENESSPIFYSPEVIPLPQSSEDSVASIVVGAMWNEMLTEFVEMEESREQAGEDTEQYNLEEIIGNIQNLTSQNEELSRKLEEKEGQLEIQRLISSETAKVVKQISEIVKSQEPDLEKSIKMIASALEGLEDDGQDCDNECSNLSEQAIKSFLDKCS